MLNFDTNSDQFQWDAPLQSTLQHTAKPSISQSIVALSGFFTWDHLPHCTALISCTAASFWTLKIDTVPHYRAPTHPTEVRSRLKSETFDLKTTLTTDSSGVFFIEMLKTSFAASAAGRRRNSMFCGKLTLVTSGHVISFKYQCHQQTWCSLALFTNSRTCIGDSYRLVRNGI